LTFPELKLSIDMFTIEAHIENDTSASSVITMPMQKNLRCNSANNICCLWKLVNNHLPPVSTFMEVKHILHRLTLQLGLHDCAIPYIEGGGAGKETDLDSAGM
jgi:hypothetical protein